MQPKHARTLQTHCLPEVMEPVTATTHVALDAVGQHSVGNHPTDDSGCQHCWEAAGPNVDDGDGHEGGGPQSSYDVDVARGEI